jgi:hypothetical protein
MTRCFIFVGIVLTLVCSVSAENLVVQNAKIYRHHSAKDRIFVEQAGGLTFDDSTKALTFKDHKGDNLNLSYADVDKVVFEVDTHMRGGSSPLWALGGAVGAGIGAARAGRHVTDYWVYVAPAVNKGTPFLLVVPKDSSDEVIEKAKAIFAERVEVVDFPEKGADIDKTTLADIQSKEAVKVDKNAHPLPGIKPDKALIVVVCPALSPRGAGMGLPFKLYANGHVTAANRNGTYSFAYLDPGKYQLVSQMENANGFEIQLDAGKDYYFLQNIFQGTWRPKTVLTRNTKELVMYQADGAYYSDWRLK